MKRLIVVLSIALAGCSRDARSTTYGIPTASAAEIKIALCPPYGPKAKVMTCPRHDGTDY